MPDPDEADHLMEILYVRTGSQVADAIWHAFVKIDPGERVAQRRKQQIKLSRYARISLADQEQLDICELDALLTDVAELLKEEEALRQVNDAAG